MHEDVVFGTDATQEIERLVIAPEQDVLAVVNELASVAVDERRRPSAELRPGVQDEDSPASLRQERRRTQTSEACAYDDDIRRHGRRHLPNNDPAHVVAAMSARRGRGTRTTDEKTS